jgi:hypothetical protein
MFVLQHSSFCAGRRNQVQATDCILVLILNSWLYMNHDLFHMWRNKVWSELDDGMQKWVLIVHWIIVVDVKNVQIALVLVASLLMIFYTCVIDSLTLKWINLLPWFLNDLADGSCIIRTIFLAAISSVIVICLCGRKKNRIFTQAHKMHTLTTFLVPKGWDGHPATHNITERATENYALSHRP